MKLFLPIVLAIFTSSFAREMRFIKPPMLTKEHLGRHIVCHRPARMGGPHLCIEMYKTKTIAHNYGHGGAGWTLAPGSAQYVNQLLIDTNQEISLDTPIAIIGAGVIGFFTAYDLIKRGFKDIIIIADKFDDLASHFAGGRIAPVCLGNDSQFGQIIREINHTTFTFYATIAKGNNPDFSSGARLLPSYFEVGEDKSVQEYVQAGLMLPGKEVVLDFGNGTQRVMIAYDDSLFVDTAGMMQALKIFLVEHRVHFIHRHIDSFDEIEQAYIINCTGLGAKDLCNDCRMSSVQGHLILLKNQNPDDINYMVSINLPTIQTSSGKNVQHSFYLHPKHAPGSPLGDIGVIGGTFIEDTTIETPNLEQFDLVIAHARAFYGLEKSKTN